MRVLDASLDGCRERTHMLGSILWLEFGVRIGYFTRDGAFRVLETLSQAFNDIYQWLEVNGGALPRDLLDDALRIRADGFLDQPLRASPPADVAGLHFRHALTVVGGYLSSDQGLWSPLAGAIMFASDDAWQSILGAIEEDSVPDAEAPRPFIDDAAGLLRCMDAVLTVGNAAARDDRLDALQQEQLSIELIKRLSWPLSLGQETQRRRFSAFYSSLTTRVVGDLDASPLASIMQSDINRLRDAWEEIEQTRSPIGVPS